MESPAGFVQLLQGAVRAHQVGDLEQAESIYREVLSKVPDQPDALNLLAVLCHQRGRTEEAIALFTQARDLHPEIAHVHANLGNVLNAVRRPVEAEQALRRALELNPESPDAWNNLGNSLEAQGALEDALRAYTTALEKRPEYPEAALNRANALRALNQGEESAEWYRRALAFRPDYVEARNNLASLLMELGRFADAEQELLTAVQVKPDFSGALYNLGLCRLMAGLPSTAAIAFRAALERDPGNRDARHQLAVALTQQADHPAAVEDYIDAVSHASESAEIHSDLLLALNYVSGLDPRDLFDQHLEWARIHSPKVCIPRPPRRGDAGRVRLGFVSPDLRAHPVASFLEPVWAALDRSRFEIIAFSDVDRPDAVTERLAGLADEFHETRRDSDDALERRIRAARIDVLFDLAGHTAHNRMVVFARGPAPIQVAYLGYPNTTGLSTMDYRLTDSWADPPEFADAIHTEQLLRIPEGFLVYAPPDDSPPVGQVIRSSDRPFTFGSFNNIPKLSDDVILLWSELLHRIPESVLFLKSRGFADPGAAGLIVSRFGAHGIDSSRIRAEGGIQPTVDHLRTYFEVDLALDPFPFNGAATTCEALWMGTPVLTLAGNRHAARVGVSLLSRLGLPDFIAESAEDFIDKAARAAGDLSGLATLRKDLRSRMSQSSLINAEPVVRSIENALLMISGR